MGYKAINDPPPGTNRRREPWGGKPLPLTSLRGLTPQVGDDMLAVLDAYRHARLNLVEQVEGGPGRVVQVLRHCRGAPL